MVNMKDEKKDYSGLLLLIPTAALALFMIGAVVLITLSYFKII